MATSGFQFIEQPLFIKNCGPATTIPITIYTDSNTYEGFWLEISYFDTSFHTIGHKIILLDDYEYNDTQTQKIKGFFDNDMWTGETGNTLHVELWNSEEMKMADDIEVIEEEWTLEESIQSAYDKLYTILYEQNETYLDSSETGGFGSLINRANEYVAYKIITNPDQYSGHPSKNLTLMSGPLLQNTSVSQAVLHREFTKSTKYILSFGYQTSISTRNGFMYGFDPNLVSGSNLNTSSNPNGLNILTDTGNTYIETFNNGSTIQLYTHTSNLFTSGGYHSISIHRNGMTADIYIDKELIYTYDNIKYNTIGLNKWGTGNNQISNVQLSIDEDWNL